VFFEFTAKKETMTAGFFKHAKRILIFSLSAYERNGKRYPVILINERIFHANEPFEHQKIREDVNKP